MSMNNETDAPIQIEHPAREIWRMYRRNKAAMLGLALFILVILASFIGPVLYPVDPFEIVWAPYTAPGQAVEAPLGTDAGGHDMLAGILVGGKATLAVGAAAAFLTVFIGIALGAMAGYFGGLVDEALMRVTEFFQVLPPILFAMVVTAIFQPSLTKVALIIGIVSWPATARLTRAEFMKIKQLEYVTAARSIGAENARIIWRVVLPNAMPPLIVSATLTIGIAILFEAGLSFLGLGDPNVMSWGLMIGNAREAFHNAWWTATLPGAAIFLTVLSVSLIGDGLNDAFNPKLRGR